MNKRVLRHTFSLLNVDHVRLGEKWNYQNVISPYYRIYYIDEGAGEISDIETVLQLEPGYLYIIPSFTLCNLRCRSHMSQYFIQFFEESADGISLFTGNRSVMKVKATEVDVKNFASLLDINPGRGINRSDNPKIYEKDIFYKEYQELNNRQTMATFLETQGIILQLVSRFFTGGIFKHHEPGHIPVKIMEAISFISLNLKEQLSVKLLAEKANQHTDYFSRLFKQYTGESPINYIHEKRIERAQYLMMVTQMTFSQIAMHTGFENIFYFSKIFKKVTKFSPRQYQLQLDHTNR